MQTLENFNPTWYTPTSKLEVGDYFRLQDDGFGWNRVLIVGDTVGTIFYLDINGNESSIKISDEVLVLKREPFPADGYQRDYGYLKDKVVSKG